MGITIHTLPPTFPSLAILVHVPPTPPSLGLPTLTAYLPIVLSTLSSPHTPAVFLHSSLALLASSLGPQISQTPRPELPPDIFGPLIAVLPGLASAHPDPAVRHMVYRLIGVVLRLVSDMLRLEIMRGFLQGEEGTEQNMRVAAIHLLKDLLLEAIEEASKKDPTSPTKSVFTSPILWQRLAPVIFRSQPPDLLESDATTWEEVVESGEAVRLVECLTLYFVVLKRDTKNLVCQ